MAIENLTDAAIRAAKPRAKLHQLHDGGGLYLAITPKGAKSWRMVYRFGGRQRRLGLGLYPALSLAGAREKWREARSMLAEGLDPAGEKRRIARERAEQADNTFKKFADELIDKREREGASPAVLTRMRRLLKMSRSMHEKPLSAIDAQDVLALLRPLDARGKRETARRLAAFIGQTFKYAVAQGCHCRNPVADLDLSLVLTAVPVTARAAIIDPKGVGALWRALDGYEGQPETRLALKLLMLTAQRPGEVRMAKWGEFNLDKAEWLIPPERMKQRRAQRVPLSDQALALLAELKPHTGRGAFLFPNIRSAKRPMSDAAMGAALMRMGFARNEVSPHGFRSSFSSLANESGLWSADAIERQLAHISGGVRGRYDRGERWEERRKLAQWWADELDRLAAGDSKKIIPIRRDTEAA